MRHYLTYALLSLACCSAGPPCLTLPSCSPNDRPPIEVVLRVLKALQHSVDVGAPQQQSVESIASMLPLPVASSTGQVRLEGLAEVRSPQGRDESTKEQLSSGPAGKHLLALACSIGEQQKA